MERRRSNNTVVELIVLFLAIGVGSFVCGILERSELNVWVARGIGALVTVISELFCVYLIRKISDGKEN